MNKNPETTKLLRRTTLTNDQFKSFLTQLSNSYPNIGEIAVVKPLTQGYEDANFSLKTSNGKFIVKIFAEDMSISHAQAHAKILNLANKVDFPAVPIIPNKTGEFLSTILENFCFITKYVKGDSFENIKPSLKDITSITKALTQLNKLTNKLSVSYDSWSNSEFLWEYKRDKETLSPESIKFLLPTIRKMRMLDSRKFKSGLIHGDIQPNHILKDNRGTYHILDFGVARYDLLVFELSTHIAWFCLPEYSTKDYASIINAVMHTYEKSIPLSSKEKGSLPALIEAAYAAYFFRTAVLMAQANISKETKKWNKKAHLLLIRWRQYCSTSSTVI